MAGFNMTAKLAAASVNIRNSKTSFTPDPRYYQLAVLSSLLILGLITGRVDTSATCAATILSSVVITQYLCSRWFKLAQVELKSALISGLSLCLLLRSQYLSLLIIACVITILSKFILRVNGKHIFNPTNFGIAVIIILSDSAWISPGQWGSTAIFAAFVACAGIFVVHRSARFDVTASFLSAYASLLFLRAWRLGDPFTIPVHQLMSGALIIFSFYMISDPRTTPDSRIARIAFGCLVAAVAYYIRFSWYNPNSLILALFVCSCITPLSDVLLPGMRFEWIQRRRA